MRGLSYLKVIGIALGFISTTQNTGIASTYMDSPNGGGRGEAWREADYLMQPHKGDRAPSFVSENKSAEESHEKSIEAAFANSLLNGNHHPSHQDEGRPGVAALSEGLRFGAEEGSAHVSATPLPAALPLFAGGMGVLGFLARRKKKKV